FVVGDLVTFSVNGTAYEASVGADGTWSTDVAGSDLAAGSAITVSVTTSDAAGNSTTATATHGYDVDVDAPELTISVKAITTDNIVNAAEAGETVAVSGTLTVEFVVGDLVTFS